MAGVMAQDNHAEPLNCLIRNIGPGGAQIRICAAQSIPEPGYLIHLVTRSAYRTHAVWRWGSLTGLRCEEEYLIDDELPQELTFLRRVMAEALFRHATHLISQGMETDAALRKLGIAQDT